MNKLICLDWYLYDKVYSTFNSLDAATGLNFTDIKATEKCIRVFGTSKQIEEVSEKYNIDEAYEFKEEEKGSYWYKILHNPEEENAKIKQKLSQYKKLYQLNNNEVLILRIR